MGRFRIARHPRGLTRARPEPVPEFVEIDGLVLQRPPQPLDEDVVEGAAPAIHRERHARTQHRVFKAGIPRKPRTRKGPARWEV